MIAEANIKEKAFLFYLQGKALNAIPDHYDKEAEANLSKAVSICVVTLEVSCNSWTGADKVRPVLNCSMDSSGRMLLEER